MSVHQIEDLVETSIYQLCSTSTDRQQLRSDIHYLYEFQNQFDCKFTHFRLLSELLDCGFILSLDLRQHPLYQSRQKEFKEISQQDFDFTPGPNGGYWCGTIENAAEQKFILNKLCCDYGSPLWKQLVNEGQLSGEAASPLSPLNPYELVLRILQGVSPEEDPYLFINWYSFFPVLLQLEGEQTEVTEDIKAALLSLLCQPPIFLALEKDPFLAPEEEYLDEEESREWFAPYFQWQQNKDHDPDTLFYRTVDAFNRGNYSEALQLATQGIALDRKYSGFYYYWAYSVIIVHADEIEPFNSDKHEDAITILQYALPEITAADERQGIQFYLAVALLRAGRFAEAEESAREIASLLEKDPLLSDYYQRAEQKWRGKFKDRKIHE